MWWRCCELTVGIEIKIVIVVLTACVVSAQSATAFDYPLQQAQVREAYFLGRTTDTQRLLGFLHQYARHLQIPERGPDVAEIEFRTPYELAVLRSREHWTNYSAQDAERDYSTNPDPVVVSVLIYRTRTFPRFCGGHSDSEGQAVRDADMLWCGFRVRVMQSQPIRPIKVGMELLSRRGTGLGGADLLAEFSASEFVSGPERVQVEVSTPDGQTVQAAFDLEKLR